MDAQWHKQQLHIECDPLTLQVPEDFLSPVLPHGMILSSFKAGTSVLRQLSADYLPNLLLDTSLASVGWTAA